MFRWIALMGFAAALAGCGIEPTSQAQTNRQIYSEPTWLSGSCKQDSDCGYSHVCRGGKCFAN